MKRRVRAPEGAGVLHVGEEGEEGLVGLALELRSLEL